MKIILSGSPYLFATTSDKTVDTVYVFLSLTQNFSISKHKQIPPPHPLSNVVLFQKKLADLNAVVPKTTLDEGERGRGEGKYLYNGVGNLFQKHTEMLA